MRRYKVSWQVAYPIEADVMATSPEEAIRKAKEGDYAHKGEPCMDLDDTGTDIWDSVDTEVID